MTDEEIIKLIKDNTALGECTSQMMTVGNIKVIIEKVLEQMNSSNDIHNVSGIRPSNTTPSNKVNVHAEALCKGGQRLMAVKHIYTTLQCL